MDTDSNPEQTPHQAPSTHSADSNKILMGIMAYLSILVVVPLVSEHKNDPFVKFHAKQGLVLLICEIIGWALFKLPVFGWILAPVLELAFLILIIIGIINVVNKHTRELPVIGHLASNFKF